MLDCMQSDYFGTAERYLLGFMAFNATGLGEEKTRRKRKEKKERNKNEKGEERGRRRKRKEEERGRGKKRKKKEKEEHINKQGQKHKVPAFQHGRHHRLEVACSQSCGACQGTNTVLPCCWGLAVTHTPGEDA